MHHKKYKSFPIIIFITSFRIICYQESEMTNFFAYFCFSDFRKDAISSIYLEKDQ